MPAISPIRRPLFNNQIKQTFLGDVMKPMIRVRRFQQILDFRSIPAMAAQLLFKPGQVAIAEEIPIELAADLIRLLVLAGPPGAINPGNYFYCLICGLDL